MKEFVLLMRGDDAHDVSPTEMQARMEAYRDWMGRMIEEGRLKGGQPLEPAGRHLKNKETVLTDGPFLEPKEIIGGYVILMAADLDEAADLAKACPLLDHCEIMVRPVLEVPA